MMICVLALTLASPPTESLEVWPREITLFGPGAAHAILAPGELVSRNPAVARIESGRVEAVSDGEAEVIAAGVPVSVKVRGAGGPPALDFKNVILPILTRSGCNQAQCHGAALGQAGFKLSLFGDDPTSDYLTLTHEYSGRRIDRAEPARSLFLRKPTRQLPHRGGRVLAAGGPFYRTLLAWGERGFPERGNDLQATGLEARAGAMGPERELRILARARYSDGIDRDVTHLALFSSNDDAVAEVDEKGRIRLREPGETAIMVRFAGHVTAVRVGRPFRQEPGARLPVRNFIDEILGRQLERLGLEPSGECDDAAFLRRAHLDLTGTLPSAQEARAFLADPDRDRLVERLIARPEFDLYWGYQLDRVFKIDSKRLGKGGAEAFHAWLRGRAREPWDETARAILAATGTSPESGYFRLTGDPKEMAENTGRIFLGARWMCGQCHNHPYARFRRSDYFGVAADFARVRQTEAGILHLDRGEILFPETGKPALPALPDGTLMSLKDGEDRRLPLADWITAQPQFRRAFANRIWALLMGRGLVHPADDFRPSNPASNPELLDRLAEMRTIPELARAIAGSAAYRRAGPVDGNRGDQTAYSHFRPRPLAAEVFLDALARATGIPEPFEGRPAGTRAVDLGDFSAPSYTLDVCGRNREDFSGSLAQQLHLLTGSAIESRLGAVRELLALDDARMVEELYLRTLSRFPLEAESDHWVEWLRRGPRQEVAEDLLWALLNSWEFASCH